MIEKIGALDLAYVDDDSTLKQFKKFISIYPHEDIADIGGAGYESNLTPLIGSDFAVFDPLYDEKFDICSQDLPRQYQTIILLNTMEHLYNPFSAKDHIINSLKDEGYLFICTPFMYHHHDYEKVPDYYRFTDTGMRYLFKDLDYVDSWYDFDYIEKAFGGEWASINPANRLSNIFKK